MLRKKIYLTEIRKLQPTSNAHRLMPVVTQKKLWLKGVEFLRQTYKYERNMQEKDKSIFSNLTGQQWNTFMFHDLLMGSRWSTL